MTCTELIRIPGRRYQDGHCGKLADAISHLTGWHVYLIEGAGGLHFVTRNDNGQIIDSTGIREEAELLATYTADHMTRVIDTAAEYGSDAVADIEDYQAARMVLEHVRLWNDHTAAELVYREENYALYGRP